MAEDTNDPQASNGNKQPGMPHESDLGKQYVGLWGALVISAYLVVLTIAALYVIVKVWPPAQAAPTVAPMPTPTPSPAAAATPGISAAQPTPTPTSQKWQVTFSWCPSNGKSDEFCWISLSTSLFLISFLSGALGSLLHALRSFYWYVGMRKLVWSWAAMYLLLPFCGAALAAIFYIVLRGGFFPQSTIENSNPFGFAAMGVLVGLFSEEAIAKLKQIAQTFFTQVPAGKDTAPPPLLPPKVSSISPTTGPAAGGTHVTITGTNFVTDAKVNIGGTPATQVNVASAISITAVTPAHATGAVDVQVVNSDGQKDQLTGGFTFS